MKLILGGKGGGCQSTMAAFLAKYPFSLGKFTKWVRGVSVQWECKLAKLQSETKI